MPSVTIEEGEEMEQSRGPPKRNRVEETGSFAANDEGPFSRLGSLNVPLNPGRFAWAYPHVYACKLGGSSLGAVLTEWKNDLGEFISARDLQLRSSAARSELEGAKQLFTDHLALLEVLLRENKFSLDSLPDVFWRLAHHISEAILKVLTFAMKGPEGVELLRSKVDSAWAKSKLDYASIFEAVSQLKTTAHFSLHQPSPAISLKQDVDRHPQIPFRYHKKNKQQPRKN